ncbi:MAG: hypothetical protein LQ348_000669 [Seirophora lacunosa]|nr:MAG: hypothetical protein LQ348_000669 [Seirophora lacunosa]
MSDIQQYLLKADSDQAGAEQLVKKSAEKLESKELSLIEVVQSLGEFINDEDPSIRSKAVTYLSQVISALPDATLSRQQVQVLCQFLCDRLEDGGALGGLRKLQSLGRFNQEMAIMAFRALVEHFQDLMLRPHSQRLQILELLNDLMFKHRAALKSLGDEAIVGITDLVSGEKDPRSLMIIFSVLRVVTVEWSIGSHAEDLKTRLRDCVSASSLFAPFAFPQLIEKLDSTSPNVKKDVLQTIGACVSSYSLSVVSNYSATLWDSLKYEILNVQEEELAEEALVALQAIATRLSKGLTSTNQTTHLARYIRPITTECNEQLREPQHKQAKPVGQILSALATSSTVALYLIVRAVVPPLMTLYQDSGNIADQRALLEVLVQLYNAAVALDQTPGTSLSSTDIEHPLASFKDRFLDLFSQALMGTPAEEVSSRVVALTGLLRLCQLRNYLRNNEIGMIVQYLDEIILTEDPAGRGEVRNEAIQALVDLSKLKPDLILEITFPAFMARLPDQSTDEQTNYITTLEALARLSVERSTSDTLIRRLLSKLEGVLQTDGSASYVQALLSTIDFVLSRRNLSEDPNLSSYHEKIVVALVRRAALASFGPGPQVLTDALTLEILGRLVGKIIGARDEHLRRSIALETYTLFTEEEAPFVPVLYRHHVPEKQRLTMILSAWVLAGVGTAAATLYALPHDGVDLEKLIDELTRLAVEETVPTIRQYILRQIALLVNRASPSDVDAAALSIMQDPLRAAQLDAGPAMDATPVVFWIAKAMLLRLSSIQEILDRVLSLLSDGRRGSASARGFGTLLASDELVSKTHGAVIRLLSKQRVFGICSSRIATEFRVAKAPAKPNYLVALSGLLKHVPTDIMMMEIDTLIPLLLQSLDLPDQEVKAATIESLVGISQESPGAIEGHMSMLVGRLLQAAADPQENMVQQRTSVYIVLRMSSITDITSPSAFESHVSSLPPSTTAIISFHTPWAAPCAQMSLILNTLASSYPPQDPPTVSFLSLDAEALPNISESYDVTAVPFLVVQRDGKVLEKVSGSDAGRVREAVERHAGKGGNTGKAGLPPALQVEKRPEEDEASQTSAQPDTNGETGNLSKYAPGPNDPATAPAMSSTQGQAEEIETRLQELVKAAPVMLFMKGTPSSPQCGFSRTIVGILREKGVRYGFFNILADEDVRSGMKTFSDWPTFPQLYAGGEFVGGLDIVKEELESDPDFFAPYVAAPKGQGGMAAPEAQKQTSTASAEGTHLKDEGSKRQVVTAGAIAGLVSRFCIAPLDVVKIRLQLQTSPRRKRVTGKTAVRNTPNGTIHTVQSILRDEGVMAFWKGNVPAELLYIAYGAAQFTAYRTANQFLQPFELPGAVNTFLSGAAAGATATSLTYPLDLLRTRFAAQGVERVYKNLRSGVAEIGKTEGVRGFFRGLGPAVGQIVPYMGLFFSAYELLRPRLADLALSSGSAGASAGIVSGVLAKTGVFPLDLIRKRLQVQGPTRSRYVGGSIPVYKGVWASGRAIVRNEGWRGLYRGLGISLVNHDMILLSERKKEWEPIFPACQSVPLRTCIKFTPRPQRNLVVLSLHVTALELASVCIPVL